MKVRFEDQLRDQIYRTCKSRYFLSKINKKTEVKILREVANSIESECAFKPETHLVLQPIRFAKPRLTLKSLFTWFL